jgi:hypothetical protein
MSRRLGWLGPAIVLLGVVVALIGGYVLIKGRPKAGAVISQIPVDDHHTLVVRAEADGGDRNFVELVAGDELVWSALIPPYGGRPDAPGIAWGQGAITIRVIRDDRAEIFAVAMSNASKLGGFKLAPGKGGAVKQTTGPVTLSDHVRSYEIVGGVGWTEIVAIDLASGQGLWRQDLGDAPVDAAGFVDDGGVWIEQRGVRRVFGVVDGRERSDKSS